jgi:hypothetical protein
VAAAAAIQIDLWSVAAAAAIQIDLWSVATAAAVGQKDLAMVAITVGQIGLASGLVAAMAATVGQINSAAAVFVVQTTLRYSVVVLLVCQKARLLVVHESGLNQIDFAGRLDWAVLELTTQITLQA